MRFETNTDVLNWFEKQSRTLTPEFISAIPWHRVKDHPLDSRLIPALLYMRDVETLTDMYHRELLRTPTGKDPQISKFMERWGVEEITHGEVLNRFINEAGYETPSTWQEDVRRSVSNIYRSKEYLVNILTNLIGHKFTAAHMTFGAIHEMEAAQGYRRLMALAQHPVLSHILQAIIKEESAHNQFYWSVARLELQKSDLARKLARFVVDKFWAPVGEGSLPKKRTAETIGILFNDAGAMSNLHKTVTQRVQQLPGFDDINKMTRVIGRMAQEAAPSRIAAFLIGPVILHTVFKLDIYLLPGL